MFNTVTALAVDLAYLHVCLGEPGTADLEPEHYTTHGYEQAIADAAAACRTQHAARHQPFPVGASLVS